MCRLTQREEIFQKLFKTLGSLSFEPIDRALHNNYKENGIRVSMKYYITYVQIYKDDQDPSSNYTPSVTLIKTHILLNAIRNEKSNSARHRDRDGYTTI